MKKLWRFVRRYTLFSIAALGALVALGLDLAGLDTAAHWLLIALVVMELCPLLWGMVQDIREGTYGVDILAATAIVTALVMHEYWAGMVIVLMLTGGKALEDYAEHRARRELDALLKSVPQKAHVLRGNKEIDIKASAVVVGDTVVIRPGEVVPVDATILQGESSFDEASITGESVPVPKQPGELLVSGAINIDGAITAKAVRTAEDSQYSQIVKLVRGAANSKAPFVRLADRYAIPFTIVSFGIAGTAWALSGEAIRFLEVLVVATPCPLILAAPIAIISGMSRAASQGIIIKTGSALERLAGAKTFAFDKTGTLTSGTLRVADIHPISNTTPETLLHIAASAEQHSNHVVAGAILARHADGAAHKLAKPRKLQEHAGSGVTATIDGKQVVVGRLSLLAQHGVDTTPLTRLKLSHTATYVAINGQAAGALTFADKVRPESKATLDRLRTYGIKAIMMVTGDNQRTAQAVAKPLGITAITADALPGDKIRAIEAVPAAEQPVAFVGDGVNDAPVLTASDVGIALGARGSTIASEAADVVIMPNDLSHVADARAIARRTFRIATQSIGLGIGLSVVLMLIFSTGHFKPIHGAAIQELIDVAVIINALRAHRS